MSYRIKGILIVSSLLLTMLGVIAFAKDSPSRPSEPQGQPIPNYWVMHWQLASEYANRMVSAGKSINIIASESFRLATDMMHLHGMDPPEKPSDAKQSEQTFIRTPTRYPYTLPTNPWMP